MAWIAALGAVAGGMLSSSSSRSAARSARYSPWDTVMPGVGSARFTNGHLQLMGDSDVSQMTYLPMRDAMNRYTQGQENALGQDFLRNTYGQSDMSSLGQLYNLNQAVNTPSQYQGSDFMSQLNSGMLSNFNPTEAANQYTSLLRQQAMPQEQQAVSSALTGLFKGGRLGTTGGANQMQALASAQSQADLGRQIAGQQHGLQQQLMAQQGYDQARANQQGLMLNSFGANQQGMMNQFGMDQGMFGRQLDLYTNSASATQDRFQRAMQLFGSENALNQQALSDFSGLLGARQSQAQTTMDLARIGASVGQAQSTANANAAMIRNQGNQDMIAGFMGALNAYTNSRNNNNGG